VTKRKFGLGQGLDALLPGASEMRGEIDALPQAPIDSMIPNPRQPRKAFREDDPRLLDLSASIKEHGLLQPIIVTRLDKREASGKDVWSWLGPGESEAAATAKAQELEYQIIAGERRWRAARLAGLARVPVIIKEVTPQQMLELALIENIQRADLNPIEEALAYQALIQEFGMTQEMVAKQVGRDRSTVANSLRLLQLAPKIREALINQSSHFTEGHARPLIGITREEDQVAAMNQIIALNYNVRQAEELAAKIKAAENIEAAAQSLAAPRPRPVELDDLESRFRNALMVKVDLKCNAKGKGTIVLHFNSQDELESLYQRLVKEEE
jgi:ParB family chromosome partitioning protein